MLILGTLVVTWIAHNWWKLLLLLVAIIAIHEYVLYKSKKNKPAEADGTEADEEAAADSDTADAGPDGSESV